MLMCLSLPHSLTRSLARSDCGKEGKAFIRIEVTWGGVEGWVGNVSIYRDIFPPSAKGREGVYVSPGR